MSHFFPDFGLGILLALAQVLAFIPWALALGSETVTLAATKKASRPTVGTVLYADWLAFIPAIIASFFGAIGEATGRLVPAARQMDLRQRLLIFVAAFGALVVFLAAGFAILLPVIQERGSLERWGRLYGAILQLQFVFDVFVIAFVVMLQLWPKGGAVAVAAFREAIRQPMFWLFLGAALLLMFFFILLPYFTFGEDLQMMTEIDYA